MSFEQYIDELALLSSDDEEVTITEETQEALEVAGDALAFAQSLWSLLREQGMVTDSDTPDFFKMEKVIDLLHAEVASAAIILSDPGFNGMSKFFNDIADKYGKIKDLPPELARGARKFAGRLENAQKLKLDISDENSLDV